MEEVLEDMRNDPHARGQNNAHERRAAEKFVDIPGPEVMDEAVGAAKIIPQERPRVI